VCALPRPITENVFLDTAVDSSPPVRSGSRGPTCRGFSLAELVVVLIIIGIWASIAVPRVANSITYHRAEAAGTRIVRDIALTQARAKATSTSQKIAFDVAADCYTVSGIQHLDHSTEEYVVDMAGPPYEARVLFVNFGEDQELIYDGYGVPDSGGAMLIECGNHRRTINVDEQTGVPIAFDPVSNPMGG